MSEPSTPAPPRAAVAPLRIAAALDEFWSPRVIAEVDDAYVKVAKVHGELGWHAHADEDELFLVLRGHLRIELAPEGSGAAVELDAGDLFVVPKGLRHNPVAREECLVMLVERKSTLHTGDIVDARTRSLAEQLRPIVQEQE